MFEICSNTILWTVIGAVLGAILGVFFTNLFNKRYSRILLQAWIWEKCLEDGITKDPNLMLSVQNNSKVTIPLINVHLMDFSGLNIRLEKMENDLLEIKSGQIIPFRLAVLRTANSLTYEATEILKAKQDNFALRIYLDKSNKDPVLTDSKLALEIFNSINELIENNFQKKTLLDDMPPEIRQKILTELQEFQKK